jgi:hypothetical protein
MRIFVKLHATGSTYEYEWTAMTLMKTGNVVDGIIETVDVACSKRVSIAIDWFHI